MQIKGSNIEIIFQPESGGISVRQDGVCWNMQGHTTPYIELLTGEKIGFSEFQSIDHTPFESGLGKGLVCRYRQCNKHELQAFTFKTKVWLEYSSQEIIFELIPECDVEGIIKKIAWPQAFELKGLNPKSYTVLPMMYGCMIPNNWPQTIKGITGNIFYERSGYMPWFGQIRDQNGYIAIVETAYDAGYELDHKAGGPTRVSPAWNVSMNHLAYRRIVRYRFFEQCNYTTLAKYYRDKVKEKGAFVTLQEKIIKNPLVEKMRGTPVIHTDIYDHREPECSIYDPINLENNDRVTSFENRLAQFKKLKTRGLEKAYIHLDGWGQRGYDNLHPDVFPPCEIAGGTAGMKKLADGLKALDYLFAIHDQYRDYYYDAKTYRPQDAIHDANGQIPEETIWAGGPQAYLCTQLAPGYVRRNFQWFSDHDIFLQGAYLDVFSCMELDECYHMEHRMNRQESAQKRGECLEYVRFLGKIVSSEECVDWAIKHLDLVHHSPIALAVELDGWTYSGPAIGIPIPLFTLVYHECLVVPWFIHEGAWGIPKHQDGFSYGLLNGGTGYLSIEPTQEELEKNKRLCALHEKVFGVEMLTHEFIEGNPQKQRSVFSNGIIVEVDFEKDSYHVVNK